MIKEATTKLKKKIDLSRDEMREAFDEIMSGAASPKEIEVFLTALRDKGEIVGEITAAAKVMRERSIRIDAGTDLIDTCGTGGTGINTFNISTTAAFVASGCGVRIAKHGNRSASGHCGSADVLEALGVKIDIAPEAVAKCIKEIGIGFLFAPSFHKAMKFAAMPRKAIGGRTIFNILGPLSNPAGAAGQVVGVYDAKLTEIVAGVLKNLGLTRAFVVYGMDGLDEISVTGKTKITELGGGRLKTYYVGPEDFGVRSARLGTLKGSSAKDNAATLISILKGEHSPKRDSVLINASAAIVCGKRAKDFKEGVNAAAESIDSGKALDKLKKLIEITNRV